jgi:hypothetical protein
MTPDYRWSLGTLIWLPICALLVFACVVGLRYARRWLAREKIKTGPSYDRYVGEARVFMIALAVVLAGLVGFTAIGMWPYKAEYHQWRDTVGTVETIDSRLLSGATERFVVTFDDGRQRSCDDTRCAQVAEGDHLALACKRAWQWAGTHGYDCNYVSHRPS